MIDLSEEILPLSVWARRLPRRRQGRPVNRATLYRWATRGLKGIRLEVIHIGGTTCTSKSALQVFFNALTEAEKQEVSGRSGRQDGDQHRDE